MENVVSVSFNDDAKAYEAFSDLKNSVSSFTILSARIIEKVGNTYVQKDGFDADAYGTNFAEGGLIGALIGIIGGPLGILLGGSIGMLIGSAGDASDANQNDDIMMEITKDSKNGLVLVMITQESNSQDLDEFLQKYECKSLVREEVTEVHRKILAAEKVQKQLQKDAHEELIAQKKKTFKKKVTSMGEEIKARFAKIKEKKD